MNPQKIRQMGGKLCFNGTSVVVVVVGHSKYFILSHRRWIRSYRSTVCNRHCQSTLCCIPIGRHQAYRYFGVSRVDQHNFHLPWRRRHPFLRKVEVEAWMEEPSWRVSSNGEGRLTIGLQSVVMVKPIFVLKGLDDRKSTLGTAKIRAILGVSPTFYASCIVKAMTEPTRLGAKSSKDRHKTCNFPILIFPITLRK